MPPFLKESVSIGPVDSAYNWVKAHMGIGNEDQTAEKTEDAPIDPDSVEGKWQRMKVNMTPENVQNAARNAADAAREKTTDILNDDERKAP
jgi:hypothetical protein